MSTPITATETPERIALRGIRDLVKNQVMSNDGDDLTPPSYLDIYNLADRGLNPSAGSASPKLHQES